MKQQIIFSLLIILLTISSVTVGYVARDKISSIVRDIRYRDVTTPKECENLTMKETAFCLNDYVSSIYKFKSRNDLENPTLKELIEEGGDCLNWAELYDNYIKELGFNSKITIVDTGNKTAHAITIISDETGYCILDQGSVRCFMFGKDIVMEQFEKLTNKNKTTGGKSNEIIN